MSSLRLNLELVKDWNFSSLCLVASYNDHIQVITHNIYTCNECHDSTNQSLPILLRTTQQWVLSCMKNAHVMMWTVTVMRFSGTYIQ